MKRKKGKIIVSRTTLCTQKIKFCMPKIFFRKKFVYVQNSTWAWKKKQKNFWGKFSKLLGRIFVSYMEIVWQAFFSKKIENPFFCHQAVQLFSKSRRNGLIFFLLFFEYVWKLYDKHFLHKLDVWNCMISIFGEWGSTRDSSFLGLSFTNSHWYIALSFGNTSFGLNLKKSRESLNILCQRNL